MTENYANIAANWWTNLIQESNPEMEIHELGCFKKLLIQTIRNTRPLHSILRLSNDKIINEIAMQSFLPVNIPKGYEMLIAIGEVFVYNSSGVMVNNF